MGQTLSYIIPNNIQINIFEFDSAAPWKDKSHLRHIATEKDIFSELRT